MKIMSYPIIKAFCSYILKLIGFASKSANNMSSKISTKFSYLYALMKYISIKPWGNHCVLFIDQNRCLVKKLVIKPKQRMSYQSHELRNEHWIIICGTASVQLGENNISMNKNDYIYIPSGKKHRIENLGSDDLIMIEVQTGDGFFENDIKRYEDDYNRI